MNIFMNTTTNNKVNTLQSYIYNHSFDPLPSSSRQFSIVRFH